MKKKNIPEGSREIEFEVTEFNKNSVYSSDNNNSKTNDQLNLDAKEFIPKKFKQIS